MGIFTGLVQRHPAQGTALHGLGKGVPGAQILPVTAVANHQQALLPLRHRIVKADFLLFSVILKKIAVALKVDLLMGFLQQIAQPAGKYAPVPQRPAAQILPGRLQVRLLTKGFDPADLFSVRRDNIAVFLTGISGLHPQQHKPRTVLGDQPGQLVQHLKIGVLHIGIHRTDDHRLLLRHLLHIPQITGRKTNGRKGIPSLRLHTDLHLVPQLVNDGADLLFPRGYRDAGLRIHRHDLPVYPHDHGFLPTVPAGKHFQKLFGTDVIGKRPEPLPASARQ